MNSPETASQLREAAYFEAARFKLPHGWEEGRPKVSRIAIDAPSTRDCDDAFLLKKHSNGWRASVSISDVGTFLVNKPAMREYAECMAETRYLHASNIPMLPPKISENELSLRQGSLRPVITTHIEMAHDGEVRSVELEREACNTISLTYASVNNHLRNEKQIKGIDLRQYEDFAKLMLSRRQARGSLAIYDPEQGIMTDEEGKVVKFEAGTSRGGQLIVQEVMILANVAMAEYVARHNITSPFRNHAYREGVTAEDLKRLLAGKITEERLAHLYDRARYSTELHGHVGLNLEAYMHWTSPLRRLADFIAHMNVVAHLENRALPYSADKIEMLAAHANNVRDERHGRSANFRGQVVRDIATRVTSATAEVPRPTPSPNMMRSRKPVAVTHETLTKGLSTEELIEMHKKDNLRKVLLAGLLLRPHEEDESLEQFKRDVLSKMMERDPIAPRALLEMLKEVGYLRQLSDAVIKNEKEYQVTVVAVVDAGQLRYEESSDLAPTSHIARGYAYVRLIARLAGMEPPTTPVPLEEEVSHVIELDPIVADDIKDPKVLLNQYYRGDGVRKPVYDYKDLGQRAGANAHEMTVRVWIDGQEVRFTAVSRKKEDAAKAAALKACRALKINDTDAISLRSEPVSSPDMQGPYGRFHDLLAESGRPRPTYTYIKVRTEDGVRHICTVHYIDAQGNERTLNSGFGKDWKVSRQEVSELALAIEAQTSKKATSSASAAQPYSQETDASSPKKSPGVFERFGKVFRRRQ